MARRTTVPSLPVLFLFLILLICCTSAASAEGSDFDISEGNIWSLDYLDSNTMQSSDNQSASDGDFINLIIPVYNSNLSSEDSAWSFSFGFGGQWYGGHSGILEGNQSLSEIEISFGPVSEGIILCKLEVDDTLENEILEIRVGPNPVNFTSAGDANLVLIGQPAHVGDELTASILVHNQGETSDSVQLQLKRNEGNIIVLGNPVIISPGSSREVSVSFTPLSSGTQSIEWAILGSNGGIDISLNGTSNLDVQESQDIVINIDQIFWTLQDGLNLEASVSLSSGLNRNVIVSIEMKSGNDYSLYQTFSVDLSPGIRNLHFNLGHPDASRLKISVTPDNWVSLQGVGEKILDISPPLILPSIMIVGTSPDIVSVGDTVFIDYILENKGTERSSVGSLRVVGIANDIIFSEHSIPAIDAGARFPGTITILSWEYSQTTDIKFVWMMEEAHAINQTSVIVDSGTSTSFHLPFNINAAIYGALSGVAIVMTFLVAFRVVSHKTPSTFSSWNRNKLSGTRISRANQPDEKKEIHCPGCNQRLNVPLTHKGSVKCPACTMVFTQPTLIEDISDNSPIHPPNSGDRINEPLTLESSSESDLLSCPQCEQTLRVSLDKRPIRSRCPACRAEFIAKFG